MTVQQRTLLKNFYNRIAFVYEHVLVKSMRVVHHHYQKRPSRRAQKTVINERDLNPVLDLEMSYRTFLLGNNNIK